MIKQVGNWKLEMSEYEIWLSNTTDSLNSIIVFKDSRVSEPGVQFYAYRAGTKLDTSDMSVSELEALITAHFEHDPIPNKLMLVFADRIGIYAGEEL